MATQKHQIIALSLALLVLISTTGISMKMMLCHCTGKEYWTLITSKLSCCKLFDEVVGKTTSCCSKKEQSSCPSTIDKKGNNVSTNEKCCSSKFQYAKANINLDLVQLQDLPYSEALIPTLNSYSYPPIWAESFFVPKEIALAGCQNKAPPKFSGQALLHWLQVYRC